MAQEVKIILTGDAKSLIAALKKSEASVDDFADSADKAGKKSETFGKNLKAAAAAGGAFLLAKGVGEFVTGSIAAGAQMERLESAADRLGAQYNVTGQMMVDAIQTASGGTIPALQAMQVANSAMTFGIAKGTDDMANLVTVATALGRAAGQDAATSIGDLTTALARGSTMILDNLGITLKLSEAYQFMADKEGVAVSGLTALQKSQAFATAALAKGAEVAETLGGVMGDTASKGEMVTTSFSDFQVAFGEMVIAIGDAGVFEFLIGTLNRLTEGAETWAFGLGTVIPAYFGNEEALARLNQTGDEFIETQEGMTEAIDLESIKAEEEAFKNLTLATADWVLNSTELTKQHRDKQREISQEVVDIHKQANQDRTDNNDKLNENLDKAEKKKNEAMASLVRKASKLTDDEYSFRRDKIIKTFEESKAATIKGHKDTNQEIQNGLTEQNRILEEQRAKEKADFEAHILELKTKTSLGLLESTGELSALTGGLTDNAEEAFNLIKAGIIPVEGELAAFLGGAHKDLTKNADEFRAQAEENTKALEQAFSKQTQAIDQETEAAKRLEDQAKRTASAMASITNGSSGGSRVPGLQGGGSFTVPPGFPNDSFMMGVSSGENVNVSPVTNNSFTFNTNSPAETRQNFHMARAMS